MMNLKTIRFTIISTVLLGILSVSSRQIRVPDLKVIRHRYANLLNSLVQVNVERVDTIKKLLKLYDYNAAQRLLRIPQNRDGNRSPVVQNEYLDTLYNIVRDSNRFCSCRNKDSDYDSEETYFDEHKDKVRNQEKVISDFNLRVDRNEHLPDAFFSVNNNQLWNKRIDYTSSEETDQSSREKGDLLRATSKKRKLIKKPMLLKPSACIRPHHAYHDCKVSCREAVQNGCNDGTNYCSDHLVRKLRRECKRSCKTRFKDRYEDGDDDD